MRISDWSSDVCSSDLDRHRFAAALVAVRRGEDDAVTAARVERRGPAERAGDGVEHRALRGARHAIGQRVIVVVDPAQIERKGLSIGPLLVTDGRSEECRGGKECVSQGRSRWTPYQSKKKQKR